MRVRTLQDAKDRYGEIIDGKWADESAWCQAILPPPGLKWINSASGQPVGKIYCNKDMAAGLVIALTYVVNRGLASELESFDGCLMVRMVRGSEDELSTHAFALAIDVNAKTNQLGQAPTMSPALVKCFTDSGFTWGGLFHRKDGMHFSWGWEYVAANS